jgi:hypothetical protein
LFIVNPHFLPTRNIPLEQKSHQLLNSLTHNLVPRAFLVVARELRKTLVKYDEISKILVDLSHAQ